MVRDDAFPPTRLLPLSTQCVTDCQVLLRLTFGQVIVFTQMSTLLCPPPAVYCDVATAQKSIRLVFTWAHMPGHGGLLLGVLASTQ